VLLAVESFSPQPDSADVKSTYRRASASGGAGQALLTEDGCALSLRVFADYSCATAVGSETLSVVEDVTLLEGL
jgi:hypothetical protein